MVVFACCIVAVVAAAAVQDVCCHLKISQGRPVCLTSFNSVTLLCRNLYTCNYEMLYAWSNNECKCECEVIQPSKFFET
jgi:hypothetical protein